MHTYFIGLNLKVFIVMASRESIQYETCNTPVSSATNNIPFDGTLNTWKLLQYNVRSI